MSLQDQIAVARDSTFSARVAMLLMKTAVDVANESDVTTNHANRLALSQRHMRTLVNVKAVAAAIIAYDAGIQATINANPGNMGSDVADADITTVLAVLYDILSNAYAADLT